MGKKKIEIDQDTLSVIENSITAGVNEGVKRAMLEYDKAQKNKSKIKYDKRLRNTKLLLKNYREFCEHCEKAVYSTENAVKKEIKEGNNTVELFEELYNLQDDALIVTSILKSKERTKIILEHIKLCLEFYEHKAAKTKNLEMQRRYDVIKRLYINEETESYEEISEILHISTKTVDRDRRKATQELSVLLFGIDGLDLT